MFVRHTARKAASILLLALTLALPTSALATTSSGSTAETLDNSATIALTVPTTATYAFDTGTTYKAPWTLGGLQTNNPLGAMVTATFSTLVSTAPAATIQTTNRFVTKVSTCNGGGTGDGDWNTVAAGGIANASSVVTLLNYNTPITSPGGTCAYFLKAQNVPIGLFSGTVAVTAATK